jgi:hypothetical protein
MSTQSLKHSSIHLGDCVLATTLAGSGSSAKVATTVTSKTGDKLKLWLASQTKESKDRQQTHTACVLKHGLDSRTWHSAIDLIDIDGALAAF